MKASNEMSRFNHAKEESICSNIISMNMGSNSADHAEVTNLSQAILLYGKKIMAEIAWKEYPFLVRV
jgi:hypothetical protein